jgi:hypothetical protein
MGRPSVHQEPHGATAIARHYIRDLIYGANDGLITTFAVVAGVSGGALSSRAVIIIGVANLAADGLSMGVGNYLSIRSHESARAAQGLVEEEARPARHGMATLLAFVVAGSLPLVPYVLPDLDHSAIVSIVLLLPLHLCRPRRPRNDDYAAPAVSRSTAARGVVVVLGEQHRRSTPARAAAPTWSSIPRTRSVHRLAHRRRRRVGQDVCLHVSVRGGAACFPRG